MSRLSYSELQHALMLDRFNTFYKSVIQGLVYETSRNALGCKKDKIKQITTAESNPDVLTKFWKLLIHCEITVIKYSVLTVKKQAT